MLQEQSANRSLLTQVGLQGVAAANGHLIFIGGTRQWVQANARVLETLHNDCTLTVRMARACTVLH